MNLLVEREEDFLLKVFFFANRGIFDCPMAFC